MKTMSLESLYRLLLTDEPKTKYDAWIKEKVAVEDKGCYKSKHLNMKPKKMKSSIAEEVNLSYSSMHEGQGE